MLISWNYRHFFAFVPVVILLAEAGLSGACEHAGSSTAAPAAMEKEVLAAFAADQSGRHINRPVIVIPKYRIFPRLTTQNKVGIMQYLGNDGNLGKIRPHEKSAGCEKYSAFFLDNGKVLLDIKTLGMGKSGNILSRIGWVEPAHKG